MSLYRIVFRKACHLLFELEHKAYWAIQKLNFDAQACGETRTLQINELDELRLNAYENDRIYKEKTKQWHGKNILARAKTSGIAIQFQAKVFSMKTQIQMVCTIHCDTCMPTWNCRNQGGKFRRSIQIKQPKIQTLSW